MRLLLATSAISRWSIVALTIAAGCAASDSRARLAGVDLRPVMSSLREDARAIAVALAERRLEDAREPAGRLAAVSIGRPSDALEDRFRSFAADLNAAASELVLALDRRRAGDASDPVEVRAAFARVLARCDACHAEYRPGAGSVAP